MEYIILIVSLAGIVFGADFLVAGAVSIARKLISLAMRWKMKYGFGIRITPNQSIPLLAYSFYDTKGNEIDMKEEVEMK